MEETPIDTKLKEVLKTYAKYISIVIHNTIEDMEKKDLSVSVEDIDKHLDSTIVNSIYTALYAFEYYKYSDTAREFVEYNLRTIPRLWPDPEFLEGFEAEDED